MLGLKPPFIRYQLRLFVENCIAASPCSRKSFYAHMRVDDGLCAHAGGLDLFVGLPTVQCLVVFLHTASNQKLDSRKA